MPPAGQGQSLCRRRRCRSPVSVRLPQIVHLAADAHEHIHFVPPQAGLAEETAQGHQEVVGVVAFEIVDGEERFFEAGVEQCLFLRRDCWPGSLPSDGCGSTRLTAFMHS